MIAAGVAAYDAPVTQRSAERAAYTNNSGLQSSGRGAGEGCGQMRVMPVHNNSLRRLNTV